MIGVLQALAPGLQCCCWVCVPGQKFWHTHVCENCGSSWTHIAPTPMTQAKNREIHTCTKCGTMVYGFVIEPRPPVRQWGPWVAGGALAGLLVAGLFDRH